MLSQYNIGDMRSGTCKSQKRCLIQASSAAMIANARYSAFVEERDTICCLFEAHEIGLGARNTTKPEVDLLS